MLIALIHGQNHKGSSYHIGRMLAEKLEKEDNIKEVFLPKDMPHFCCGCTNCFMKDESLCPHYNTVKKRCFQNKQFVFQQQQAVA